MASTVKIGINGMGRIGRAIVREYWDTCRQGLTSPFGSVEIVAVNNPGDPETYAYLLEHDSVHGSGRFQVEYDKEKGGLEEREDGRLISFYNCSRPGEIPWSDRGVDVVVDATGRFRDRASLREHLGGSVKKVVVCAPGKDVDGTFVMGINHGDYKGEVHHIVSNASCTTNCLAPIAKVLHESFGLEQGFATTVHAYTADQRLLDSSHSDLRRARAAALSMIPTSTGAAKAVGLVIPELNGKLDGVAIRVPTPNVSLVDLSCVLSREATVEEINGAFEKAQNGYLKGILKCEKRPLVSVDFVGMKESSCVDMEETKGIGRLIKVFSWYDNEIGFSNRVLDLAGFMLQGEKT